MIKSAAAIIRSYGDRVLSLSDAIAKLPRTPRLWAQLSIVAVIAAVIIYAYFSPVLRGYTFSDISNRQNGIFPWANRGPRSIPPIHYDQTDTFYPWQVFINRAFRAGEVPLWNPFSFAGHPFFANGQNGAFYPPKACLSLIASPTRAHDSLLLSHMLLGGVLMFLLLNRLRLCFGASLFGGVAWMLNSFMLSWMALEHFVVIEAWLPLAVLLMERMVRGFLLAAAGLGFVLAMIFFGGNLLFVELCFVMLGAYGLYLLARRLYRPQRKKLRLTLMGVVWIVGLMIIAAAVCLGLIAVQLLPTLEVVRNMDRATLSVAELVQWKLPAAELRGFFLEPNHMINLSGTSVEEPYHRMMFLGTPTALLALVGFWRNHPLVAFMRVSSVVLLLIALGTPVTGAAMLLIPGFGHLRPLGRVLFLFDFAVAVLAAFGLDWMLRCVPRLVKLRLRKANRHVWRFGVSAALAIIVVVQMYSVASWVVRYQFDRGDKLYPETPLIRALGHDESSRMLAVYPSFYGSTAMPFGIYNAGGYDSLLPTRITRLWRVIEGIPVASVVKHPPTGALATLFSEGTRFDLLPRLCVTHVVTPPDVSLAGCKGGLGEPTFQPSGIPAGAERNIVSGDWDGDGTDAIGAYDPHQRAFMLWKSNTSDFLLSTLAPMPARPEWIPIAGDWNGDGKDEVGLYDSKKGVFHFYELSGGHKELKFGPAGTNWIPIAGDWNGDQVDSVGLFDRKGYLHLQNSLEPALHSTVPVSLELSDEDSIPLAGDWDGNRVDTIGVYSPSRGAFYVRNFNSTGAFDMIIEWGPKGKNLIPLAGNWRKDKSRSRMDVVALFEPAARGLHLCGALKRSYSRDDGNIYEVRGPLPRAHLVESADVVENADAALRRFADPAFDPDRSVILESDQLRAFGIKAHADAQGPATSSSGRAEIIARSLNSLSVRVDTERDVWLVVTESWDKGWHATLDGVPVAVLPGNYAFRAVPVPRGEHVVEMIYNPSSFVAGKGVSICTLVILFILIGAVQVRRFRSRR